MGKIRKLFILVLVMSFLMASTVQAKPYIPGSVTSVDEYSELLAPGVTYDRASETSNQRGDMFASADLVIENEGNGNIGALAVAYTREPVDEAYITVFLDQWDEDRDRWVNVEYYEAEFYAEDYPDGLVSPSVDITFTNQERGYYYRLRGSFSVVKGDIYEGFSPATAGILIE